MAAVLLNRSGLGRAEERRPREAGRRQKRYPARGCRDNCTRCWTLPDPKKGAGVLGTPALGFNRFARMA